MQCREVRDLLDSFLGEELLVETNHDLMRHLETCPDCRAELEARRQMRIVLGRAFNRAATLQPRPDFAASVLAQVRTAAPKGRRRLSVRAWLALAASMVLTAGAASYLLENRVADVVRAAVGDHLNCAVTFRLAERPIPLAEAVQYDPVY